MHPVQRRFLCQELKQLAEAWPEHPVIFKPRTSSIESTLHRRHGEMAGVIDRMSETVPNLELSFKPATRLLRQCGCAITVSSTAALEAMAMGVSTRIVGDLGVTETLGNHFFAASGAVAEFASIRRDPFSVTHDPLWLQATGASGGWRRPLCERPVATADARLTRTARGDLGPSSWGSASWQRYAVSEGGRRMLSSGGARSSQRKRHQTRNFLRRLRDGLVGFGWLSKLLRER